MTEYYAHSAEGKPQSEWQRLEDHLIGTAKRASGMAAEFGCAGWGYIAGIWHDIGKYSQDFQNYIKAANDIDAHLENSKTGRVDHSTAGAIYSINQFDFLGRIIAYQIAGHHAGLPDFEADETGNTALSQRILKTELLRNATKENIPLDILNYSLPNERPAQESDLALWIRLLFSCLVDADFLDTEDFYDPLKTKTRGDYPTIESLLNKFTKFMQEKIEYSPTSYVNEIRANILQQCINRAADPPGISTLTVPTGGGKTLSSMGFALNHAVKYKKRRIIYVIPYTSIIEQNAQQFRDIFDDAVIEHQSNLDTTDEKKDNSRSRLACENWDAPIIVTTSVQFFESLFASRTSRCRKLHNIVNSVVILDEAQLIPPEYLNPILHILRELQKNYGVTILFSTATQPAFGKHKTIDFKFDGLPDIREIIDDPLELHKRLKRTEIIIPKDLNTPKSWEELTNELIEHNSVLCIVNRRDDCRILWEKMPEETFHLSALMCGAHRSDKIKEIKARLINNIPTRVISTQLVEAGVDLDFPIVYRALAGLDSIAQAAGRCNREGKQSEKGKVIVFIPPSNIPAGYLRQAALIGKQLLSEECEDILTPTQFEKYFKELYWIQGDNLDKHHILKDLKNDNELRFSFRTASTNFHIIDESKQATVIVTYKEGGDLIKTLENTEPNRALLRKLQRYTVNIPRYLHSNLLVNGAIYEVHPGIYVQTQKSMYDDELGFCPDKFGLYKPDEYIF
jgi:CRISPR-associated endonuclease/helicase Cas3